MPATAKAKSHLPPSIRKFSISLVTSRPTSIIPPVLFRKTALIGVGLLGGSLGLALRRRGLCEQVVGYVRREASIVDCRDCGVVDEATMDLAEAVAGADLVVLCTPLAQMRALLERMRPQLKPGALITDVGSVKGNVVAELSSIAGQAGAGFIGSHPMAGSEQTGPKAAREDLFENAVCVLTPERTTPPNLIPQLRELWEAVGARTLILPADQHDNLVGRCSHLPHIVAAGLANYVLSPAHPPEQQELCSTGFRDTTRVASGSPEMWRDISLANRRHLQRVLGVFIEDLQEFQLALERGDEAAIMDFFETAKQRRDHWQHEHRRRDNTTE